MTLPDGQPGGGGLLLQTNVERVPLGEHHGRDLTARVEHRVLRLALRRGWSGSLTLGRRRPVAIEVIEVIERSDVRTMHGFDASSGEPRRYDMAVPRPVDPWPRFARRMLVLAGAGWLVVRLVHRLRREHGGDAADAEGDAA